MPWACYIISGNYLYTFYIGQHIYVYVTHTTLYVYIHVHILLVYICVIRKQDYITSYIYHFITQTESQIKDNRGYRNK